MNFIAAREEDHMPFYLAIGSELYTVVTGNPKIYLVNCIIVHTHHLHR